MFRSLAASLILTAGLALPAFAERVVVVELYTSQGCSSCPPADQILYDLHQKNDDVLALSLHVDYWDYLGWKDEFANPEFTARQAAYNDRLSSKYRLVTPQMVFNGQSYVAGAYPGKVYDAYSKAMEDHDRADLSVSVGAGNSVEVSLEPVSGSTAANVYLVQYGSRRDVAIARGENAGKTLDYLNVVTGWTKIGEWDGASAASFQAEAVGSDHMAIIVQEAGSGPVLAAWKLEAVTN